MGGVYRYIPLALIGPWEALGWSVVATLGGRHQEYSVLMKAPEWWP